MVREVKKLKAEMKEIKRVMVPEKKIVAILRARVKDFTEQLALIDDQRKIVRDKLIELRQVLRDQFVVIADKKKLLTDLKDKALLLSPPTKRALTPYANFIKIEFAKSSGEGRRLGELASVWKGFTNEEKMAFKPAADEL